MQKFTLVSVLLVLAIQSKSQDMRMSKVLEDIKFITETVQGEGNTVDMIRCKTIWNRDSLMVTLSQGYTYTATANASDRVEDLDMELYVKLKGEWVFVKEDDTNGPLAELAIRPDMPGEYKFLVKVVAMKKGEEVGNYGIALYHK